jgi:hypothetical protein
MTTTTTERPAPPFKLSRIIKLGDHHLVIGEHHKTRLRTVNGNKPVHPQFIAGWNAVMRQHGHRPESARFVATPQGFHAEFRSGWEAAKMLLVAMSTPASPLIQDPVTIAILELRSRRKALELSEKDQGP